MTDSVTFSGSIPKIYDEILGPAYFVPYAIETAKRAAAFHPKTILEVACGTGIVTKELCKSIREGIITATDISADMLSVAKEKLSSEKNIIWKEANAMELPFADEKFDLVVCQFGAKFFQDKQKAFSEMHRVLKKSGKFIFSTWDKLSNNPVANAGRQILLDFFEGNPPPNLKTAFSMSDENEIKALLQSTSFTSVNFEIIYLPCIAESAELLAFAQVDGSIISNLIREKDENAVPVLRNKIAESISGKFGNNPVKGTMQAIVVTAEKK